MRYVFVGTSSLTLAAARTLITRRHEIVLIERDKEVIQVLDESLDCGFIHGDGSKPRILREAGPENTAALFCLTGNDQTNILATLVGRSLGFPQTVTRIEDEELEHICLELGLENYIVPARAIGRHLADFAEGQNTAELSSMIKGDARLFSFVASSEEVNVPVNEIKMPAKVRIICIYRDGEFIWPKHGVKLRKDDEVVVITHTSHLKDLEQLWGRGFLSRTPNHKNSGETAVF